MLLPLFAIVAGFVLLVWAADRFVFGASAVARNVGISPIIIGLTIVGFGTSAPEMVVSAVAAWEGSPDLGIGNAIGSNITNVGLVLGVSALIAPLAVRSETLRREFPVLFAIMLFSLVLVVDGELSRLDGALLLGALVLIIYWVTSLGLRERANHEADPLENEFEAEIPSGVGTGRALLWVAAGLVLLLLSSRLLVWGAVEVALAMGISELVIGLTVVAIGTSLPELAASVMSALRNEHDIAVGNVLGSNMFNLLAVLGFPGLLAPGLVPPGVLERDYPVMIVITLAVFAMAYGFRRQGHVNRLQGLLLVIGFAAYVAALYFAGS
jgi:cation:H+ antiporter